MPRKESRLGFETKYGFEQALADFSGSKQQFDQLITDIFGSKGDSAVVYTIELNITHVTVSRIDKTNTTHLLYIEDEPNQIYISNEHNIYSRDITLCGLHTTTKKYIKSKKAVTCRKCLQIMAAHHIVLKEQLYC